MIEAIHQSSLNMALRCGEQFRRRYVENEIVPPSIAAGRGTGVHAANKVNLKQKIETAEDLPLSDLQDATRDGYVHAFDDGVFIPSEDLPDKARLLNEGLEDALRCTKVYRERVSPDIHPIAVEAYFKVDVGLDIPLAGSMDYLTEPKIGDLKTTTKAWADGRINEEIQPTFYSYVHEREKGIRPEFVYHVLIARRGKNGPTTEDLQDLSMTATDSQYNALFAKLTAFVAMVRKGAFIPANPTSWWCSERWCGYWRTCPYVGNSPRRLWI